MIEDQKYDKESVVQKTSELIVWWINTRLNKIKKTLFESASFNPLLAPLIMGIQSHNNFEELAAFLIDGHLLGGHNTGFGKLIDEKILPQVFNTTKLDAEFRKEIPYNRSEFDNIDHIIKLSDGNFFLSQKAGKWTIQLGQAVELNRSFLKIIELRDKGKISFEKIVVATYYGTSESLTDKYRILRGINTGKKHDVVNITEFVDVYAGREFWTWLGKGEERTQDWIMEGILLGLKKNKNELDEVSSELKEFRAAFAKKYSKFINEDEQTDWYKLLKEING
jgi:hypothetical protein